MAEEYIKARTTTTDRVADWLQDCGVEEAFNAEYVTEECERMFPTALDLVTRADGGSFSTERISRTMISSPWVPYVEESYSTLPPKTLGSIRLEANLDHQQRESGLILLGQKAVMLVAQSTLREEPRVMAVLRPTSLDVALRGPGFKEANVGDVNAINSKINWHMPKILLPRNPDEKIEREKERKI